MSALFGWQGFWFEHPEDWAPVTLTGDRRSGYARLASPRTLSLQVRWAPAGGERLEEATRRYLDRLARDAKRSRRSFTRDVRRVEDEVHYRYRAEHDGEGRLFPSGDGRVVFLEAIGDSTTARARIVERARRSFGVGAERWSVLGLRATLPLPSRLESKEFLAGRTRLELSARRARVVVERWGLADRLLDRMDLQEWAGGRLGGGWAFAPEGEGLRATRRAWPGLRDGAIVRHQPEANQITMVRVRSREAAWRPDWDWLT